MQPLDPQVHYGITDRDFLDVDDAQIDLLPVKLHELRWKLNQKAKKEPKFRFYALYDRVFRMDVLKAAWKRVGKKGKASGIDGVRAEDILAEENGVEKFLAGLHEELKTKSYFDTIPHDKLLACVRMRIADRGVLELIRGWLRAPIIETDEKTGKPQPPRKSDGKGTPQGRVISPLLANVYVHCFDAMFHRVSGPRHWANARLVRYADDFVVMARYQGPRIDEWLDAKLEGWLGLTINREKTKVVNLDQAESLDFLGFTFRYDRDLFGSGKTYLNVVPSKKSLKKAWDAIREETGAKKCFKPTPAVVKDLNTFLRGWSNYFDFGYPRKAFRDLSYYARKRMVTHLNRRSQRKYHRPKGMSHYQYLQELGLLRLGPNACRKAGCGKSARPV
jgi:RNA-directed DNA polymerase